MKNEKHTQMVDDTDTVTQTNIDEYPVQCIDEECNFKWNFGSFTLSFLFSMGTGVWWTLIPTCFALLPMIPYVGIFAWIGYIVSSIVMGFKGPRMAWKAGNFKNEREFNAVMKSWNYAGIAATTVKATIFLYAILCNNQYDFILCNKINF